MEGLFSVTAVKASFFWGGGFGWYGRVLLPVIEGLIASSTLIKVLETESGLIVVIEKTRVRLGSQVFGNHLLETVAWIGCTVSVSVDVIGAGHGCALRGGRAFRDILAGLAQALLSAFAREPQIM